MDTLQISLFGHVSVVHPQADGPLKLSRSTQGFFAYLLLQQTAVPRDVLMDVFWQDHAPDRARSSLTTALWRLRHLLEPEGVTHGTYIVTGHMGEVGFNWDSGHFLDTESFEQHIYPLLRKPIADLAGRDIEAIEQILKLYTGDLLEGMYDDWALRERERFRSLHLNCLTRLMECYVSRKNYERSIALAREILRRDPVREEIHRALMRIYFECGQRTLAVRQYIQCRDLLSEELGVLPLEETTSLFQQVIRSSRDQTRESSRLPTDSEIARLLDELQSVRQGLVETARALDRIDRSVAALMSAREGSSLTRTGLTHQLAQTKRSNSRSHRAVGSDSE